MGSMSREHILIQLFRSMLIIYRNLLRLRSLGLFKDLVYQKLEFSG